MKCAFFRLSCDFERINRNYGPLVFIWPVSISPWRTSKGGIISKILAIDHYLRGDVLYKGNERQFYPVWILYVHPLMFRKNKREEAKQELLKKSTKKAGRVKTKINIMR